MTKRHRLWVSLASAVLWSACGGGQGPDAPAPAAPPEHAATLDCAQLMQPVIDALWGAKPAALESRFAPKVVVVEQKYELVESDPPYQLGPAQSRALTDKAQLATLVKELAARAGERDDDLIPNPREALSTDWSSALAGSMPFSDARLCAITLEIGDVEHVLVAALDKDKDSITGLYTN
jgi:hypothetical protein